MAIKNLKKIVGFGALAAGAVFLLSSFTNKKTTDTGTSASNCDNPEWINASPENWQTCQQQNTDPNANNNTGTPGFVPTWENIKFIGFVNPFNVTVTTKTGPPGGLQITSTSIFKVFGYSVTRKQYVTDNWSLITPDARFIVPSWFVVGSSSLATLESDEKIIFIDKDPDWSLTPVGTGVKGLQLGPLALAKRPFAYYNESSFNPNGPTTAKVWQSIHGSLIYSSSNSIDVFGIVKLAGKPIYLVTNKGILLSSGCPAKYKLKGLRGICSM